MVIAKVVARAWKDAAYKSKLLRDPNAVLADVGVTVPAATTVKVLENTLDTRYLVLPMAPENASELSFEELVKVAHGFLRPLDDMIEKE